MKKNRRVVWMVGFLLLAVTHSGAADTCSIPEPPAATDLWDALTTPLLQKCINNRTTDEMKRLRIDRSADNAPQHHIRTIQAWEDLLKQLDKQRDALTGDLSTLFNDVQDRARLARQSVATKADSQAGPLAYRAAWVIGFDGQLPVLIDSDKSILLPALALEVTLSAICAAEGNTCPETAKHAVVLTQGIHLAKEIGSFYGRQVIEGLAAKVAEINAEWDRFLFNSKPMYPWDLWLTDVLNRKSAAYDQNLGLREAPDNQYFWLHPAPGFSLVTGAADGDELQPTVYVELLGINRWRWRFLTGASAIVEYADRRDTDDVSWGILLTFANRFNVGVTAHGGDVGITLGLDLANFYREQLRPQIDNIKTRLPN